MSHDLITAPENVIAELKSLADRARDYAENAKAPNTRRAYAADVRAFKAWCQPRRLRPLPAEPETVAAYLVAHAPTLKVATLMRRLSAIREAHQQIGVDLRPAASPSATSGRASATNTALRQGRRRPSSRAGSARL